ncbi:MAG TPA: kelch repeat-containing protein, partial [bacterium]|nr:kelch repeat-containing protein [bacterium]
MIYKLKKSYILLSVIFIFIFYISALNALDNNSWEALAPFPDGQKPGPGYTLITANGNNNVFVIAGAMSSTNNRHLYKYNYDNNTWTRLNSYGTNVFNRGSCGAWNGGNYIYALRGTANNYLLVYNIGNNVWTKVDNNMPRLANVGSSMVWGSGNYIYITESQLAYPLVRNFYAFNVANNVWTDLSDQESSGAGTSMTIDLTNNIIYASWGHTNSGNFKT